MDADHIVFDQESKRWYCGNYQLALPESPPRVAIIGSRKASDYGYEAINRIIGGLRGHACTIMSGMAMGVDQYALTAALQHGLRCIGIPGSGLSNESFSPASARSLAQQIIDTGGCLLSPFAPDFHATRWSFVVRNALIIELASIIVIPECEIDSGSFDTATKAMRSQALVAAVPGPINAPLSSGTNELLTRGCRCIRDGADIATLLSLERRFTQTDSTSKVDHHIQNEYEFAEHLHDRLINDGSDLPLTLAAIMKSENANTATVERALCILIAERKIRIENGLILPIPYIHSTYKA